MALTSLSCHLNHSTCTGSPSARTTENLSPSLMPWLSLADIDHVPVVKSDFEGGLLAADQTQVVGNLLIGVEAGAVNRRFPRMVGRASLRLVDHCRFLCHTKTGAKEQAEAQSSDRRCKSCAHHRLLR